jgi:2-polyprenyl-3-methyl-5-hydroxy-6-metoxy-1,4-benzoquinol methylase
MMSQVRADFDRIALLSEEGWTHNSHYHGFLLRQLPAQCEYALDIGCGTGAFSRLLAARSDRVLALDLSPQMIHIAQERSGAYPNIEYQVADVQTWEFPPERFDCIVSVATLHHLPLEGILLKMRSTLKVNGMLVVLDLYKSSSVADMLTSVLAMPVHTILQLLKTGRLRQPPALRQAWAEHGRHDTYLTLQQIRQVCAATLPGAQVRKHLLWRYSITWEKEAS